MNYKDIDIFRGERPPRVKNQRELVEWALRKGRRDKKPINTAEFVYDLRMTRFGSIIFDLRNEGWIIETKNSSKGGDYLLIAMPEEELQLNI